MCFQAVLRPLFPPYFVEFPKAVGKGGFRNISVIFDAGAAEGFQYAVIVRAGAFIRYDRRIAAAGKFLL